MDLEDSDKWQRGLNVTGLKIDYKKGKRYCQFFFKRELDCGLPSGQMKTPPILIMSSEENVIQLGEQAYDDIEAMLAEAQDYISGKRAQGKMF